VTVKREQESCTDRAKSAQGSWTRGVWPLVRLQVALRQHWPAYTGDSWSTCTRPPLAAPRCPPLYPLSSCCSKRPCASIMSSSSEVSNSDSIRCERGASLRGRTPKGVRGRTLYSAQPLCRLGKEPSPQVAPQGAVDAHRVCRATNRRMLQTIPVWFGAHHLLRIRTAAPSGAIKRQEGVTKRALSP
jgi:hypothetical protein